MGPLSWRIPSVWLMLRPVTALLTKYKNLNTEAENLREKIEEESEKKNDVLRAVSKAQAEIQLWRSKFEVEGLGRIDELEASKHKLSSRVQEAEEAIDALNSKVASTEKTKHRLEAELEDLQMEYERTHAAAIITGSVDATLIRLLENGRLRLTTWWPNLKPAMLNAATTTLRDSESRLP